MMWETPKGSLYKEESNNILKEVFMKMKTKRKALLLSLCAVLLVVASVMGTMAYLTSQDTVTNTFTVGKVNLTLDEAPVDTNGKATTGTRVKENRYKLLPGQEYDKDPTVHVTADSEDSYIFVKVENGLADYEDATSAAEGGYKSIADQIIANGWTRLDGVDNVYYQEYGKVDSTVTADTNLVVFEEFKLKDTANEVPGWGNLNVKITITAYAIQKAGFDTPAAAWAEVSK